MTAFMLHGPAWWCENCQTWWPGSWPISFGAPDPDVDDSPYADRTCAECGEPLVPRARPLKEVHP